MHTPLARLHTIVVVGTVVVGGAFGGVRATVPMMPVRTHRPLPAAACSALGTYQIGPRILPMGARRGAPSSLTVGQTRRGSRSAGASPPSWLLRGTLTIAAYSGCGQATAGTFAVQQSPMGPLFARPPTGRASIACDAGRPCGLPMTGVLSATGTFAQDVTHPQDPVYTTISATVVTARPGPQTGRPCAIDAGCPPVTVMTSTVTFSGVTGYLQTTATGQAATLSFLPPPAVNDGQGPTAVVLTGTRRSQVRQVPAPHP